MPILFLDNMQKDTFGGIRGDAFREFLRICFSNADFFTLSKTVPRGYELVPNVPEAQLLPFLLKAAPVKAWYGYERISITMIQNIYRTSDAARKVISDCYDDIFLTAKKRLKKVPIDTVGRIPKQVSVLEDICFFSRERMLLGTVSHERFCSTNMLDEKFAGELLSVGAWKEAQEPELGIEKIRLPR